MIQANNIYFYNNYHNGDVFYSKEFVKDIQRKIGNKHYYIHNNNPSILKDVNIEQIRTLTPPNNLTVSRKSDDIYINTWVGQGGAKYLKFDCSLKSNYLIYTDVYNILGIKIEPICFYIPEVNFNKVDKSNIDDYFSKNINETVLVCNNNVHSGQAENFNFDPVIDKLSNTHKDTLFIMTNNTSLRKENTIIVKDIIGFDMGNLLEISYLSTKVNTIIGRASGPFCFAHIKENMNDENKIFISFTNSENEGKWVPDSESKAKQYWFNKYDNQYIIDSIENIIRNNE